MTTNHHMQNLDALRPTQPLVQCASCGKEPRDVVETPCCGDVWCWQCAVERPPTATLCSCGSELALESFRPAKAIQTLLKRNQTAATRVRPLTDLTDLRHDDALPCPENCGAVLPAGLLEEHLNTCGEVEEPCPNNCDQRRIKRKLLATHVCDECPLTNLTCKFGCSTPVMRCEMDEHVRDNVGVHLDLLHATVEAQRARISELEAYKSTVNRHGRLCMRRAAICSFFLLLAFMLAVSVPWVAQLALATFLLSFVGFKRAVRGMRRRRPLGLVETGFLFGSLFVAITFTFGVLWRIV